MCNLEFEKTEQKEIFLLSSHVFNVNVNLEYYILHQMYGYKVIKILSTNSLNILTPSGNLMYNIPNKEIVDLDIVNSVKGGYVVIRETYENGNSEFELIKNDSFVSDSKYYHDYGFMVIKNDRGGYEFNSLIVGTYVKMESEFENDYNECSFVININDKRYFVIIENNIIIPLLYNVNVVSLLKCGNRKLGIKFDDGRVRVFSDKNQEVDVSKLEYLLDYKDFGNNYIKVVIYNKGLNYIHNDNYLFKKFFNNDLQIMNNLDEFFSEK